MSISISPSALLASELYSALTSATASQPASTTATAAVPAASTPSTSSTASSATTSSNPLVQDMTSLLQALASGNVSEAQSDITKLKADLKAQQSTSDDSSSVTKGHGHHHHAEAASASDASRQFVE